MTKRRSNKARRGRGRRDESGGRRPSEDMGRSQARTRLLTPLKLGLTLGVLSIGFAIWWGATHGAEAPPVQQQAADAFPASRTVPGPASAAPAQTSIDLTPPASLMPQVPSDVMPINTVDPMTGEPILATSPTTVYKGMVIAFCCKNSAAYKGGWLRMSESQKDAFVRRCMKDGGG